MTTQHSISLLLILCCIFAGAHISKTVSTFPFYFDDPRVHLNIGATVIFYLFIYLFCINKATSALSKQQINHNSRIITLISTMIGKTWRCCLMYCSRKWVSPTDGNSKPKPINQGCLKLCHRALPSHLCGQRDHRPLVYPSTSASHTATASQSATRNPEPWEERKLVQSRKSAYSTTTNNAVQNIFASLMRLLLSIASKEINLQTGTSVLRIPLNISPTSFSCGSFLFA